MKPGPQERPQENIQDGFLNQACRDRTLVTILLTSGAKLTGRIKGFDKYSVILEVIRESDAQEQLLFKHAISSVILSRSPATPGAPANE